MKPGEEMHAAVEEVDLDPCDLYTDLGTLIVEGRVPGQNDKGFGEGPHCSSPHGQNRHQCDPSMSECQKYEQILKHMLLLWKNGIPMTIEVLLYPGCCSPFPNVDSVPDMPYILLEQWTIHMLPRRVPDAGISPRGLIQAVRSFLYFSQLSAWYSLTGGKSPQNVHYRVCVPGEAFSSKFSSQPDFHIFPVSNTGRNSAMKVLVKCHPRCGDIPTVPCHKHSEPTLPLKARKEVLEKKKKPVGEYLYDGILPTRVPSRTNSPADSMLGESLLDPPNSLCMYPKRYQSPSRCGSPSIEVPEHLMFGKPTVVSREGPTVPSRRSRPQRRPVVERFLKKDLGVVEPSEGKMRGKDSDIFSLSRDSVLGYCNINASRRGKDPPPDLFSLKQDTVLGYCGIEAPQQGFDAKNQGSIFSLNRDAVLGYCAIDDCIKEVPREEMDVVLRRLRDRHVPRKKSQDGMPETTSETCLAGYVKEMRLVSGTSERSHDVSPKSTPEPGISKPVLKQPLWLYKDTSRKTCDKSLKLVLPSKKLPSTPKMRISSNSKTANQNQSTDSLANKLNTPNRLYYDYKRNQSNLLRSTDNNTGCTLQRDPKSQLDETYQRSTYSNSFHQSNVHPKHSTINIKKCGALLSKTAEELTDEREIPGDTTDNQILQPDDFYDSRITAVFHAIPSAEKKAIFRRSLDSATSLVFHKRSGLPLTSSPAPSRKCGTCFDYDSSLTSVSAIKRALFEKEAEVEVEVLDKNKNAQLSTSAPASIFSSSLLGTFEESVLNGRLEPVSTVEGFTAEIGASGSFCPRHIKLPVTVFFYTLQDMDKVTSPYMGHINLRSKDYHVPKKGTVQVTLFNPHDTVVKMFVVRYDLSDMPVNCQTFLRQRTLYMPSDASEGDPDAQKWLRYLIHLRFMSSKSGRIYLHTDIRLIIFRKSDLDAATVHGQRPYELRTFMHGPLNPKFSPHKP